MADWISIMIQIWTGWDDDDTIAQVNFNKRTALSQRSKEAVNKHAKQTTSSKQNQLGIITASKRELITSETETSATNSLPLSVQLQLSKTETTTW